MAGRKGIDLVMHLPDEPVRQPHDPPRIGQVLTNLIGNAIKFTPAGGRVDVELLATAGWRAARRSPTPAWASPPTRCRTSSSASGVARGAPELRASGSGLGLSIVKSIVDMHEGTINILSAPDRARA